MGECASRPEKKKKTTCKPRTAPAYGRAVKKKQQRVNLEPRRPMAARLKKQQRVNLEPRRPMAARLKTTTTCKPRTAPAYGRAVKKRQRVNLEPRRPMAARLKTFRFSGKPQ